MTGDWGPLVSVSKRAGHWQDQAVKFQPYPYPQGRGEGLESELVNYHAYM